MKRLLLILFTFLFTFNADAQVSSSRRGNVSTVSITNNISDIGWISDASNNVYLNVLTDFVGIGLADPTSALEMRGTATGTPLLKMENIGSGGFHYPQIWFINNDPSPTDFMSLGVINSYGDSDAGTQRLVNQIFLDMEDVSDGAEAGYIGFEVMLNGVLRTLLRLDGFTSVPGEGHVIINEDGDDIDFRVEDIDDANAFFVQGSDGKIGMGIGSPSSLLHLFDTNASLSPHLLIESTFDNATGYPVITLRKNEATPSDGDLVGIINFDGDDSGGGNETYVNLFGVADNKLNNSEAGQFVIQVQMNSTSRSMFKIDGDNGSVDKGEIIFNEDSQDVDFRIETDNNANALFIDGGDAENLIGMGTASPLRELHILSSTAGRPQVRLESTDGGATGPSFMLMKNSASPADDDELGSIIFNGDDLAGSSNSVASITGYSSDVTTGDEAGEITMSVSMGSSIARNLFNINGFSGVVGEGEVIVNEDGRDVDFRIESDNNTNALFVQGSTGNTGIGTSSPSSILHLFSSGTSLSPHLLLESTFDNATGYPVFTFRKNEATPSDGDVLGVIHFDGDDSGGGNEVFSSITGSSDDVSNADEGGRLHFQVQMNNVQRSMLSLDGYIGVVDQGEIIFNQDSQNIDFRVETDGNANGMYLDGTTENFGHNTGTFDGTSRGVIAVFNGTAPAAGTANQSYMYAKDLSSSSEMYMMDEAGNESIQTPHDDLTGKWIFFSKNVVSGRVVRVEMEELIFDLAKMMKEKTGKDYVYESKPLELTEGMIR